VVSATRMVKVKIKSLRGRKLLAFVQGLRQSSKAGINSS